MLIIRQQNERVVSCYLTSLANFVEVSFMVLKYSSFLSTYRCLEVAE